MYCDCTIFHNSCPKISIAISFITNVIVGDSLNYHNNMAFTTQDQDDDRWSGGNCATDWGSAGWFNICFKANPNGQYIDSEKTNDPKYLVWYHWKNSWVSLKSMKLMIRPRAWHQVLNCCSVISVRNTNSDLFVRQVVCKSYIQAVSLYTNTQIFSFLKLLNTKWFIVKCWLKKLILEIWSLVLLQGNWYNGRLIFTKPIYDI